MSKKKIAVLHSQVPFVTGGAEMMVKSLTEQLRLRGYEADIVSIPFMEYPLSDLTSNLLMWRLLDLTKASTIAADLVIATKFPTYGIDHPNKTCWLMHQLRQVYDLYNHPQIGFTNLYDGEQVRQKVQEYDYKTLSSFSSIYTISNNVRDRLKHFNNIESQTLYHPPSLAGKYISRDYGEYILSAGRLNALKRNDLLIKALPHCDKRIKAKFAGKGPELEPLQALAKSLGVSDRVEFLGFVPDEELVELYANAFAVYFAPLDEDYGYITLEAFLSQRPVLTCEDSGGVLEFVTDAESGYVCAADAEQLGGRLNALYNDKKLCGDMGKNGYERVKNISWDIVIDRLTEQLR